MSKNLKIFTIILVAIIIALVFIPKDTWEKFSYFFRSDIADAASFSAASGGNWNRGTTWGVNSGLVGATSLDISKITGDIYVNDREGSKVVVLNPDGTASTSYNGGSFSPVYPESLSLSSSDQIYLSDYNNQRIILLNPNGTASTSFNGDIFSPIRPTKTFIAKSGEIYIADYNANNRIVVLNSDGTGSTTFNGGTLAPVNPYGITISSTTGAMYISDISGKIYILNSDGSASTSTTTGLTQPLGLDLDQNGYLYVADHDGHKISIFNSDGTASTSFTGGSFGSISPYDVKVSNSGYIYVAGGANKIFVFNPNGTASTSYDGAPDIQIEGTDFPGPEDNVDITSGKVTLTEDQNVHSVNLEFGGELDLNGHILNVYGNWTNSGGTLSNSSTTASSTVNFAGTSTQRIIGANTFENLTKNSTTTSSLLFDPTATTTVNRTLNLLGASGNLLSVGPALGSVVPTFDSNIIGTTSEPFISSYGVTTDSFGNVYISDASNNDIQEFSATGTFVKFLDTTGLSPALHAPYLLAADSHDNIYVVDYGDSPDGNGRIIKFDSSGLFSTSSPSFHEEGSIAVDSDGNMYFGDYAMYQDNLGDGTGNNQGIVKLAPDFSVLATTTSPNGTDINFNWNGLSVFGNYLYFADDHNNRIVKLNKSDLSFVSENFGPVEAQFDNPSDIHLDSSGDIYVLDFSGRIIKLSPDFSFLAQFGNNGFDDGQIGGEAFQFNLDINDNVYVADRSNHRVIKFIKNSASAFNIVLDPAGTSSFAYLSVSGSNNQSLATFDCTNGCVDVGSNINWTFPIPTPPSTSTPTHHFRRRVITDQLEIPVPTSISGGGGNGASQEFSSSTLITAGSSTSPKTFSNKFIFTKNLWYGLTASDVKLLQKTLNSLDFVLAKSSYGSANNETDYFGPRTKRSVIRFQKAYKLPPTGFFGPMTREIINKL